MQARLAVYMVLLLVALNLGGLVSLVLDMGRGHIAAGLGKLLVVAVLDVVGFRLLKGLRED